VISPVPQVLLKYKLLLFLFFPVYNYILTYGHSYCCAWDRCLEGRKKKNIKRTQPFLRKLYYLVYYLKHNYVLHHTAASSIQNVLTSCNKCNFDMKLDCDDYKNGCEHCKVVFVISIFFVQ